jgi:hypothetical protein
MTTNEDPRVVIKEFGLLNAGLFNKIRFPGRYEVDESGNRISNSEYNMPRIDFTGDLSDLYVEPDTFYLEPTNQLMMRKRTRDEEGHVTDVKRLKVGQLDLTATEQLKSMFLTESEQRNVIQKGTQEQINALLQGLEAAQRSGGNLFQVVSELEEIQKNGEINEERLTDELRGRIASFVTRQEMKREIDVYAYRKGEVDQMLSEIENAVEEGRLDAEQNNSTAREGLEILAKEIGKANDNSNFKYGQLTQALGDNYVPLEEFRTSLNEYVKTADLEDRLEDYVTDIDLGQQLQSLASRTFVNDNFATIEKLDKSIRDTVQTLTSQNVTLNEDFNNRIQSHVTTETFPKNLERYIPRWESLIRADNLEAQRQLLTTHIQQVSSRVTQSDDAVSVLRDSLQSVENAFEQYRDQLVDKMEFTGTTSGLKDALEQLANNMQGTVTENESFRKTAKPLLGLGDNAADRTFAKIDEVSAVEDEVGTINQTELPALNTRVDNLRSFAETTRDDMNNKQLFADNNYVNKNDPNDISQLAGEIQLDISGYSQSQMQQILDNFIFSNGLLLNEYALIPRRLFVYRLTVTKNADNTRVLDVSKVPGYVKNEYDDSGSESSNKLQIMKEWVPSNPEEAGNISEADVLTRVNGISTDYSTFQVLLNKKDVYVVYPLTITVGQQPSADKLQWSELFPRLYIEDTTGHTTALSSDSDPCLFRRREVQAETGTNRRVDRITAHRPWKSTASDKRPGQYSFILTAEIAPKFNDFNYVVN